MVRKQEKSDLTGLIKWKFQKVTFFFAHPLPALKFYGYNFFTILTLEYIAWMAMKVNWLDWVMKYVIPMNKMCDKKRIFSMMW